MRYWLFFVFFILFTGFLYAQPDKSEVRRGNRLFGKESFVDAELEYRRAIEKDSTSIAAHYNLNNARYKQNLYEQAETGLKAKIEAFSDPVQRAYAFHNLGNMQLKQKKYAESIDSYKDALRLRPDDMETKSNLAYAQKMLENQQNQQDQDNQDQNQDDQNQDQNQDNQNQDQKEQDQKEQEVPPKISPQDARQMLEAMLQKEKETQEKVNKEKVKVAPPPSGKNW
ncbi:MAG: tetratricopeptide repeat protein [Prevotellaceae bacterium]|jgi:tetratricopeptide (TPR) repeat protein|nr:tetratricopeptide repeat protein [Prevotellaceae bacterium]